MGVGEGLDEPWGRNARRTSMRSSPMQNDVAGLARGRGPACRAVPGAQRVIDVGDLDDAGGERDFIVGAFARSG